MVLLARNLGAGETMIGFLISLTPFLLVLQLVTTNYAEKWGYRQLMLAGWFTRSFMLLLIVPLPFLIGKVSNAWLLWGLALPMIAFNTIRGFAAGAWLPWLTQLVPVEKRGRYLGIESQLINLSASAMLLGCGWFLGKNPAPWRYSFLFAISWAAGMMSVWFLKRVPAMMPPEHTRRPSRSPREIAAALLSAWRHKPLRRTTRYVALYTFAITAIPGFLVIYLRDQLNWEEGRIVILQSVSPIGCLMTAHLWGRMSDRSGSRPLLRLSLTCLALLVVPWCLSSAGFWRLGTWTIVMIYLLWGVAGAAHNVPQVRLVLGACPPGEVTVGMSMYQILTSLSGGIAPVLWGYLLELLKGPGDAGAVSQAGARAAGAGAAAVSGPAWLSFLGPFGSAFSILFLACVIILLISQFLLSRVEEPKAMGTRELFVQMFWEWPIRAISGGGAGR